MKASFNHPHGKKPEQSPSTLGSGMRRSVSLQSSLEKTKNRESVASSSAGNATWGSPPSARSTMSPFSQRAQSVLLSNLQARDGASLLDSAPLPPTPELLRGSIASTIAEEDVSVPEARTSLVRQSLTQGSGTRRSFTSLRRQYRIYDDPEVVAGYASIPLIELDKLPRGGVSFETKAVGRMQFGIPPETIKDSMILGIGVPSVYIVPVERFCREIGPALGINLAEFEFPAYFNYFVKQTRCTLVVDSMEAEENIRRVFEETLLGPAQFRDAHCPVTAEEEDFCPTFPKEMRPDFYKEFQYFRMPGGTGDELTIDTLIDFCHFEGKRDGQTVLERIGVPPTPKDFMGDKNSNEQNEEIVADSGNETPVRSLRHVSSNPNLRKLSIEEVAQSPPTAEVAPQTMPRLKEDESLGSASGASFMFSNDDVDDSNKNSWMYSQVKWLGEVSTVYPSSATDEQRRSGRTARVEIFRMSGGTEYIVHDIDENNIIVGKTRFSGTVRVPDEMAVEGFLAKNNLEANNENDNDVFQLENVQLKVPELVPLPTFYPPSFGVTVLGNSHGFDKKGSTSGYVLWINGRGVMIDPPPYSSATLEREGIRPQTIMAIIVTHCHADHDAGTFQKVMTGSRVAIITTPTIYRSFIRKYAALSGLSPTLLRHSHRRRFAIIGQPLRFQGATFHFTYTLHTIPCIGFRVEWRGRSVVFTGDHLNSPTVMDSLQDKGILSKERADDLRRLPLQECDVLLHEAGAPPIHTPLSVLQNLPDHVRNRLYVVHTSALPEGSGLRVAPTGTAGTIRLDGLDGIRPTKSATSVVFSDRHTTESPSPLGGLDAKSFDDGGYPNVTLSGKYLGPMVCSGETERQDTTVQQKVPPQVFLRPTCVSDAWFILNLLSAVPFLSSLSYAHTMEVLEIAQVEVYSANEIVIPAHRRMDVLCVIWEGTCVERESSETSSVTTDTATSKRTHQRRRSNQLDKLGPTVWHAGDWTGPIALQPDTERSAEAMHNESPSDVVAVSEEGVKVITLQMKDLHKVLKSGSKLFRKYLALKEKQTEEEAALKAQNLQEQQRRAIRKPMEHASGYWHAYDSVLEVLRYNSALARLTALQQRHLESLAEGPRFFKAGAYLWQIGAPVEYSFLVVAGSAVFDAKPPGSRTKTRRISRESVMQVEFDYSFASNGSIEEDKQLVNFAPNSEYSRLERILQVRAEDMELNDYDQSKDLSLKEDRMKSARNRFCNNVLARLYSRHAFTGGLVFSRGNFLSDTSRMVSGNLAYIHHTGRPDRRGSICDGLAASDRHVHTSNLVAGADGCVVMVFPRSSLVQFLDGNPGVLLSLLGTQVVV